MMNQTAKFLRNTLGTYDGVCRDSEETQDRTRRVGRRLAA